MEPGLAPVRANTVFVCLPSLVQAVCWPASPGLMPVDSPFWGTGVGEAPPVCPGFACCLAPCQGLVVGVTDHYRGWGGGRAV